MGAAEFDEPAGEETADRGEPGERPEIEADDTPTQVVWRAELRIEFAFDVQSVKQVPAMNKSSAQAQTVVTGARASSERLKPPVPRTSTFQLARPSAADSSAPTSAPAAEAGGEDPEHPRPGLKRVRREQRQENVEVEADVLTTVTIASTRRISARARVPRKSPRAMPRIIVGGSPVR